MTKSCRQCRERFEITGLKDRESFCPACREKRKRKEKPVRKDRVDITPALNAIWREMNSSGLLAGMAIEAIRERHRAIRIMRRKIK